MSIRILSTVWDKFPGSGADLLTMLALADWSDDAGKCYPSMASIARKVRLSECQARRVVHRMIEAGFLKVTANATGGATSRRYQIILASLTPSADATPSADDRGIAHATPPLAPAIGDPSHSYATRTVNEPSLTVKKISRGKKSKLTLKQFLEACKASGEKTIPENDPVFEYAETVGLDNEMIAVCWREFKAAFLQDDSKRQKDWRAHFRNAVRRNWYKLWYLKEDEATRWTSAGEQARRAAA